MSLTLNWLPAASVNNIAQQAKKRIKGTTTWDITDFSPANNLSASATTTVALGTGLQANTVYEFQIDSICTSNGPTSGVIREGILWNCSTVPSASTLPSSSASTIDAGVLSAFIGSSTLLGYSAELYDSTGIIQLASLPIVNIGDPAGIFTGLTQGTQYIVRYRLYASLNAANAPNPNTCGNYTISTQATQGNFFVTSSSSNVQINDITVAPPGLPYGINAGAFPVTSSNSIDGLITTPDSYTFDISYTSATANTNSLVVYVNSTIMQTYPITIAGTFTITTGTINIPSGGTIEFSTI